MISCIKNCPENCLEFYIISFRRVELIETTVIPIFLTLFALVIVTNASESVREREWGNAAALVLHNLF